MAGAGSQDRPGGTGRGSSWQASAGGRSLDPSTLDPILDQGRPSTFSRTTSGQRVTFRWCSSDDAPPAPRPAAQSTPEARLPRPTPETKHQSAGCLHASHHSSPSQSGSTQATCWHPGPPAAWDRIARHMASAAKADRNQSSQNVPGQHRAVRHQSQRHPRRQAPGHRKPAARARVQGSSRTQYQQRPAPSPTWRQESGGHREPTIRARRVLHLRGPPGASASGPRGRRLVGSPPPNGLPGRPPDRFPRPAGPRRPTTNAPAPSPHGHRSLCKSMAGGRHRHRTWPGILDQAGTRSARDARSKSWALDIPLIGCLVGQDMASNNEH